MARQVIWAPQAKKDLKLYTRHIGRDSLQNANAFNELVLLRAGSLSQFPYRGREVPEFSDEDLREIFVFRHRLIYRVTTREVFILALVHGSRDLARLASKKMKSRGFSRKQRKI